MYRNKVCETLLVMTFSRLVEEPSPWILIGERGVGSLRGN